ncbi:MAG: 16S rRNA (cytidine(1402)-2'-O)-methyltransferase [Cardiobacteriaceae bacterium]|nr:16S rRNA (cytidine(1402)-2'-O)-methyltransferase [Cardiobacteriaceae bacterium]
MNPKDNTQSGILYMVATPIGNLDDISSRALHILRTVDAIACEDTRVSQKLLSAYGIHKALFPLHQHNEHQATVKLLARLQAGEHIAFISDAGTPLVADPGFWLTRAAHEAGIRVCPIVGASSILAALSASGLPADTFCFAGFIPSKAGDRKRFLENFINTAYTTVFFETPHRIAETLAEMKALYPATRRLTIARELTKQFEQIVALQVGEASSWLAEDEYHARGEFVLVLEGYTQENDNWQDFARDLYQAGLGAKSISQLLAEHHGANKKAVYAYVLSLADD